MANQTCHINCQKFNNVCQPSSLVLNFRLVAKCKFAQHYQMQSYFLEYLSCLLTRNKLALQFYQCEYFDEHELEGEPCDTVDFCNIFSIYDSSFEWVAIPFWVGCSILSNSNVCCVRSTVLTFLFTRIAWQLHHLRL